MIKKVIGVLVTAAFVLVVGSNTGYAESEYDFIEYDVDTGEQKIISFSTELFDQLPNHLEAVPKKMQPFGIIGEDNREMVQDTTKFPFSAVANLDYNTAIGSGAMIEKDLFLTCAHGVWNQGFATNGSIIPGRNGRANKPFGEAKMKKIYIPKKFTESGAARYDFALVKLGSPIGLKTGWFGLSYEDKIGENFTISGYPADRLYQMTTESQSINQSFTYENDGMSSNKTSWLKDELNYLFDTVGGHSGSPIYDADFQISAVHVGGYMRVTSPTYNVGSRVSKEKFAMINHIMESRIPVSDIQLSKTDVKLDYYQIEKIEVKVLPENTDYKGLHWGTEDSNVATVSDDGTITAVGKGNTQIIVTSGDGKIQKKIQVHVNESVAVESVSINPPSITLAPTQRYFQLEAVVEPANASDKRVVWSVEGYNGFEPIEIDQTGRLNNWHGSMVSGTVMIKATTIDGGHVGYCKVTLGTPVKSVELDTQEIKLGINEKKALKASVKPENAKNKTISWTSSNENVATVDDQGEVTALRAGVATITATTEDGQKTAACKVDVYENQVTDIQFLKERIEIEEGTEEQIALAISPENATNKEIIWKIKDDKTASVSESGMVYGK